MAIKKTPLNELDTFKGVSEKLAAIFTAVHKTAE